MQKITTFLWFDNKAEEAANFYVSLFKNSKVKEIRRYGDAGPGPKGSVMTVTFQIEGQDFIALNGGPHFSLTPAISLFVNCQTQEEVDQLWENLSAGGRKDRLQCRTWSSLLRRDYAGARDPHIGQTGREEPSRTVR